MLLVHMKQLRDKYFNSPSASLLHPILDLPHLTQIIFLHISEAGMF